MCTFIEVLVPIVVLLQIVFYILIISNILWVQQTRRLCFVAVSTVPFHVHRMLKRD